MADTEKPVLPPTLYPTKTRLRLAEDLANKRVVCWHFLRPEMRRKYDDRMVTAAVEEFERHGLAERGSAGETSSQTSNPRLTPAGEEWLNTHGASE